MSDLPDQVHQATLDTIERVRLEERERIIKLLEPEVERHQQLLLNASAGYLQGLIELIKGETNV